MFVVCYKILLYLEAVELYQKQTCRKFYELSEKSSLLRDFKCVSL